MAGVSAFNVGPRLAEYSACAQRVLNDLDKVSTRRDCVDVHEYPASPEMVDEGIVQPAGIGFAVLASVASRPCRSLRPERWWVLLGFPEADANVAALQASTHSVKLSFPASETGRSVFDEP